MRKLSTVYLTIFIFAIPFLLQAQKEPGKDREPHEPTPEKEKVYGLISITGNIGPVIVPVENWSSNSPGFKIGIHYNFSDFFSVSFGGGIAKYSGPEEYILDREGINILPMDIITFASDYYFGPNDFEESWYSFQLNFKVPTDIISPYVFAGFKYASIDYKQEMFFRYPDSEEYLSTMFEVIIDKLGVYAGGGLAFEVTSYLEVLTEIEYDITLNTNIFEDRIIASVGFRFTI